jgi:hypothetical protein
MYNNFGSIINSQLNIGTIYRLKFPRSPVSVVFKLFAKYDTTMPHQVVYTFKDMYGNKVDFTNGVFKNMKVTEFIEPPPIIKRIDIPPVNNDHVSIPLGLPSNNKDFVPEVISIETYIGINDGLDKKSVNNNLPIELNTDGFNYNLPIGLNTDVFNNNLPIGLTTNSHTHYKEDDLYS